MGTRSDIIALCGDGKWRRIYCHCDGYLEHNGLILFNHYTDPSKIDTLMGLGDLSFLDAEIGTKHNFDKRPEGQCNAYGRDRGEKDVAAWEGESLPSVWPEEGTWTEYTYVWDGARWRVGDPGEGTQTLYDLGEALLGNVKIRSLVKSPFGVLGQHSGALDKAAMRQNGA